MDSCVLYIETDPDRAKGPSFGLGVAVPPSRFDHSAHLGMSQQPQPQPYYAPPPQAYQQPPPPPPPPTRREQRQARRSSRECGDVFLLLLAIILPFWTVAIKTGCGGVL